MLLALVACGGTDAHLSAEKSVGYPGASPLAPSLVALSPMSFDGSAAQVKTQPGTLRAMWNGDRLSADVRQLDGDGNAVSEWSDIRTAMDNASGGAALFEPDGDTLHFIGLPGEADPHSASICGVYAFANLASQVAGETWFRVPLPFAEAEYGPLRAMTVTDDGIYMASIEPGQATLMSCPLDVLNCAANKETVADEDRMVAGIGVATIAGSPLVAWSTADEGTPIVESRIMTDSGWNDLGVIELPTGFGLALAKRRTTTLEILQGYGRILLVVQGDHSVTTPHRHGQVVVYELADVGWQPMAHLAYPTAPNSSGEPAINARLTQSGLVVLSLRCLDGNPDQCRQTGWRAYHEETDAMVEWSDTPPMVTEAGEILDEQGRSIVVDTLPSADGAVFYPGLPEGRVVLQGGATFPVHLERRNWGHDETAQGDANISCTVVGTNPGRLEITCDAQSPHFNEDPTSTEPAYGVFQFEPLPAAMTADDIRGTLQLNQDEVVLLVDTVDFPGAWGEQPLNVSVRLLEQ